MLVVYSGHADAAANLRLERVASCPSNIYFRRLVLDLIFDKVLSAQLTLEFNRHGKPYLSIQYSITSIQQNLCMIYFKISPHVF